MHKAMQEIHEKYGKRFHGRRPRLSKAFEERMQAIHDEVAADLEAGLITQAEAHERLQQAREELHERLRQSMRERPRGGHGPEGRRHREGHEEFEDHGHHGEHE
jgi:hypothetical protein